MRSSFDDGRLSRRRFGALVAASVPAVGLLGSVTALAAGPQRQSSVFGGVTIGMIGGLGLTATDPASVAAATAAIGLSAVELGSGAIEAFAGAPAAPARGGGVVAPGPEARDGRPAHLGPRLRVGEDAAATRRR